MINNILKASYLDPLISVMLLVFLLDIIVSILRWCKMLLILGTCKTILAVAEKQKNINIKAKAYVLFDKIHSFSGSYLYDKINFVSSIIITFIICIISIKFIYQSIHLVINIGTSNIGLSEEVCSYLSLTIFLVCISYYPEKVIFIIQYWINRILSRKFSSSKEIDKINYELVIYKKIVILFRPKLWVYLFSIVATVFNSLEKISGNQILNYPLWLQVKPIIFEAIFSMIVVDRFINLFKSEREKIKEEAKELISVNIK